MKKKQKSKEDSVVLTPQGYEHGDKPQKMTFTKRTSCVRCGTCCRTNPPTLLRSDSSLLADSTIGPEHLVVIREAERVYSVSDKDIYVAPFEMIMVRGHDGSSVCGFLAGENVCELQEKRPAQCKAYTCYGPQTTVTGLEAARMTRSDIFGGVPLVMEAITRHDEKCSYRLLADLLDAVAGGDEAAVETVLDMLQYDLYARPFLAEKFGLPPEVLGLILGKPLVETIREFGYQVEQDGDDFILRLLKQEEEA